MRKIKKISLALVMIPLIQTGCMQDKASKITPSKSADKNITLKPDSKNQDTLLTKNDTNMTISSSQPKYDIIIQAESIPEAELSNIIEYEEYNNNSIASIEDNSDMDGNWEELTKEDEIIETAKTFIGTKYVWAANGPDCFDCSGFTKYVFKENGITLPRYSGHQAKVGIKVSFDELQKGDLVFFDTERKFMGKVNHVGIYIGNNKFIHASSAKKRVIITSFNEKPFYKRRFLKGERVINSSSAYASL